MSNTRAVTAVNGASPYVVTLEDHLGHHWLADEPLEAGGGNRGPSPTRLLLSSLGACTAITVRMYATRNNWPLTGVEVEIELNPDGPAASGANDIRRTITLQGELSPEQRKRLLDVANKCPLHKLLTGEIRLQTTLTPP
ncbi:MAG TPA: OsmC family protein [Steroidobacteraceae bacterium]|nr:OsmC family protein [Steroidobacteraceae bacterium]